MHISFLRWKLDSHGSTGLVLGTSLAQNASFLSARGWALEQLSTVLTHWKRNSKKGANPNAEKRGCHVMSEKEPCKVDTDSSQVPHNWTLSKNIKRQRSEKFSPLSHIEEQTSVKPTSFVLIPLCKWESAKELERTAQRSGNQQQNKDSHGKQHVRNSRCHFEKELQKSWQTQTGNRT